MGQPEHTVSFVPMQFVLNIHSCLGLDDEGDQTDDEEEGGIEIFLSGLSFGIVVLG